MNHSRAGLTRCLAVWLAASAVTGGLVLWLLPSLRIAGAGRSFDQLLVQLCSAAAIPALCWLWTVTTVVTAQAARGRVAASTPGVPAAVRRIVLAACGVALVGGIAGPAVADAHRPPPPDQRASAIVARIVNGLPLPDRATTSTFVAIRSGARPAHPAPRHAAPAPGPGLVTVRPGDTLWGIAARDLTPDAGDADISSHWHAIYAANRAVIGADPALIHPEQQLRLPRA